MTGGIVRSVENHGLRPLPERARRNYATVDGSRYFWEARFVSVIFDAAPKQLEETEKMLKNSDGVLRHFTIKLNSSIDRVDATTYKNPFAAVEAPRKR